MLVPDKGRQRELGGRISGLAGNAALQSVGYGVANRALCFWHINRRDSMMCAVLLMGSSMKPFAKLAPRDFRIYPVWEFCNDLETEFGGEMVMRPVTDLPVDDLGNRVVGTKLLFSNGDNVDGVLSNVDLNDHVRTEHFVALTLYRKDGAMFHLARYHDIGADTHGPIACAAFFGLDVEEIFPIAYDIDSIAIGVPGSIRRKIPMSPKRRLDDDELLRMAISD